MGSSRAAQIIAAMTLRTACIAKETPTYHRRTCNLQQTKQQRRMQLQGLARPMLSAV